MTRELAVPPPPADVSAVNAALDAHLSGRERATLWLPWALVGLAGVAAMLLAGWLGLSLLEAHRLFEQRVAELARSLPASPSHTPAADVGAMEAAIAASIVKPPVFLEHIEAMAADAGVGLLQFIPEAATGSASDHLASLRLQVRASAPRVEHFLARLVEHGPAVEIAALRLSASKVTGEVDCDALVRLHDEASLTRLAALPDRRPARRSPESDGWLPAGVFDTALVRSEVPVPSAASGFQPVSRPVAGARQRDPLSGLRLVGLLREGDRVAALIHVPGEGPALLRPSDRVGQTRFRLESAGKAWVILAGGPGERHALELDESPWAAR